jgi:hypothetical protein
MKKELLTLLLLLFIETQTMFNMKTCLLTKECPFHEYCSGNPLERIYGNCEKKFEKFCLNHEDCDKNKNEICNLSNCKDF